MGEKPAGRVGPEMPGRYGPRLVLVPAGAQPEPRAFRAGL